MRSTLVALVSTIIVFGLIVVVVTNAPNWPAVQKSFFDGAIFARSLPKVVEAFGTNVALFLIAEALILVVGLVLAILRGLPGPVFFPVRLLATVYVDLFRAVPGLLVIYLLGFGIPGLGIAGIPVDPFPYAVIALTLVYSAYVSEVYRAGIESVHWSQEAAARSLGLSRFQALRFVIVPQAVRRVIPPLLNDFIGLQKDTVLVSVLGIVEIFREAQILKSAAFNFTPFLAVALVFVVVTIPLARFTDWLVARDRARQAATGAR
ncbi:MAG TPA: amino acid ABC transporter permease [Candidatus Limnocylindrales bacterium]|jgi:polar amino acid transport system permease protein|nr:amino acid ABC transporter permease [Candidatus Limnocylindrales bacterium]